MTACKCVHLHIPHEYIYNFKIGILGRVVCALKSDDVVYMPLYKSNYF